MQMLHKKHHHLQASVCNSMASKSSLILLSLVQEFQFHTEFHMDYELQNTDFVVIEPTIIERIEAIEALLLEEVLLND